MNLRAQGHHHLTPWGGCFRRRKLSPPTFASVFSLAIILGPSAAHAVPPCQAHSSKVHQDKFPHPFLTPFDVADRPTTRWLLFPVFPGLSVCSCFIAGREHSPFGTSYSLYSARSLPSFHTTSTSSSLPWACQTSVSGLPLRRAVDQPMRISLGLPANKTKAQHHQRDAKGPAWNLSMPRRSLSRGLPCLVPVSLTDVS